MDILKNSKYQFILIVVAAGISIILLVVFFVNKIRTTLNDNTSTAPKTEISFSIDNRKKSTDIQPGAQPQTLAKKVSTYQDAVKDESDKRKNKNISFSSVFKENKSRPSENQTVASQKTDLSKAFDQEINTIRQPSQSPTSNNNKPKPAPERKMIEEQIRSVYASQPQAQSSSTPAAPKVKTNEEILAERKKLMEQGFDNNTENTNEVASSISIVGSQEITAYIHGGQTVGRGETVTVRIDSSIEMSDGNVIPRNTLAYGYVTINNNRANINIQSIKIKNKFYNVSLAGYSSDGMPGIPISIDQTQKIVDNRTGEAVERGVNQAIRMNPIGAIVGNVVGDLNRESKRDKNTTVTFIANHKLFLKPAK